MEYLQNGFTIRIPKGCFPLSTDTMLLADFVQLPRNAHVLDLGSGCGSLGLLLCARDSSCHVDGIEIDENAHNAALENIVRNGVSHRMTSALVDLRDLRQGNYQVCVSNPPYYTGGPASKENPLARRDDNCDLGDLFRAAAKALRYGGDFYLVHKPQRLAELCALGNRFGMEAKRLRLIRHTKNSEVMLILVSFRKGGKPCLLWEEEYLHNEDGTPSDYYRKVYHM